MVSSSGLIEMIAYKLRQYDARNIVVDPVMVATSGAKLISEEAIDTLKNELLPLATVITPNIPEAEILAGCKITGEQDFDKMARKLSANNGVSVLLKAGHLDGDFLVDYFYNAEDDTMVLLPSKRVWTPNTHGTGCTLSSAFAASLARGEELTVAAKSAKRFIEQAIISGAEYEIGTGHGPVNHFFNPLKI
jgi:hydroxymethylpyrimidine/phosphomethylpyrimidine kinase